MIACESTGTELSKPTVKLWLNELLVYPEAPTLAALRKCCREVKGRLALHDILSRIDDGRPSVEEAWSMLATVLHDEGVTVVWTDEIQDAYRVARSLSDDRVAARMAFKDKYLAALAAAREAQRPVAWHVSLGWDPAQRREAIEAAVAVGRLTHDEAARLMPAVPTPDRDATRLIEQLAQTLPAVPQPTPAA